MKTVLIKLFILFSPLMFLSCSRCSMEVPKYGGLFTTNNSDMEVAVYVYMPWQGDPDGTWGVLYPDTSLHKVKTDRLFTIKAGQKNYPYTFVHTIAECVDNLPGDTVSVYFFSKDTVDAYPWETVQREYKILARYDLSVENIFALSADHKGAEPVISYPPDERMRDMKMYPPYEEIK